MLKMILQNRDKKSVELNYLSAYLIFLLILDMSHVYISLREEILCSTYYLYSSFYCFYSDLSSLEEDNLLSHNNIYKSI